MKKILVPIKRVPDYEIKVKVNAEGTGIQTSGIKWIVNPFDEIAVEEALRIKEKVGDEVEVVVATIGPEDATEQLRTCLAMGADRALHVVTADYVDSYLAHVVLAKLYGRENPELVIMGKQSIDSDASQTGQLLASKLGLPQATFASKLELSEDNSKATVTREVDGGLQTISVNLPAVITTDLRLNEPRYPSLPGIVKAKKKPLESLSFSDLEVSGEARVKVVSMEPPEERSAGVKVESVEELVAKLKDEAKVI